MRAARWGEIDEIEALRSARRGFPARLHIEQAACLVWLGSWGRRRAVARTPGGGPCAAREQAVRVALGLAGYEYVRKCLVIGWPCGGAEMAWKTMARSLGDDRERAEKDARADDGMPSERGRREIGSRRRLVWLNGNA